MIGVFGNYGHSNLGDEAILRGLLCFLPPEDVIVFTENINVSKNLHGHEICFSLNRPSVAGYWHRVPTAILAIIKNVLSVKTVIIGGGGLFNDINPTSFYEYLFILAVAVILRRKTYILGVSVGPLNSRTKRWLLREFSKLAGGIYTRDEHSQTFFERSILIPDLAMGYVAPKRARKVKKTYNILVSVTEIVTLKGHEVDYIEAIKSLIEYICDERENISVTLVGMDFRKDQECSKIISDFCKSSNIPTETVSKPNLTHIEKCYKKANLVIATRLHATILAQLYQIPFISVGYQDKVTDYIKSHNLSGGYYDPLSYDACLLINQYKMIAYSQIEMETKNLLQYLNLQKILEGLF